MNRVLVVIMALATIALVCLGGVIYLAARALNVPDVLVATTGAAVGALGAVLVAATDPPR